MVSITHFLEGEKLTSALVSRGAQLLDQYCFQSGVGILLRWRIDDVLKLYNALFVQLRDHVIANIWRSGCIDPHFLDFGTTWR
jgi:hypothetical protein